jgi:ribosomal protein S18 acetylase RimI-like enzyme
VTTESLTTRAAKADDVAAITALQRRWDAEWFGAAEHDEAEMREALDEAESTRLVFDGTKLVGAAMTYRVESLLIVDPDVDVTAVYAHLLPWLGRSGVPEIQSLDRDDLLRTALAHDSWRHTRSSFDLIRSVSPDWELPEPAWSPDVEVRDFQPADAEAVHELIYVDAGYPDVPGHHNRNFEEWHKLLIDGRDERELPVLAYLGERIVGAAIGRMFSDGTGWINQLAVARDVQGKGIGKSLLVETYRRQRAAGADALGLSVAAANRGALNLYLGIGLRIDREWQIFER